MVSVLAEKQTELATLCARFGVHRLEVFGSAASGEGFDPQTSDVDFIVEFRADQELGPWLQNYFAFRDALADLLGHPVDLVMSSAMKNPYFIREANRTRRPLYGALESQTAGGHSRRGRVRTAGDREQNPRRLSR